MRESEQRVHDEIAQLASENAALREEILSLRQFIDSMQNLMEAAEQPLPEAELTELLHGVLCSALQTIGASDGSMLVLDEDSNELVFVITHGDVATEQLTWQRLPAGTGIAGWVSSNRRATIVNDAQTDDRFYPAMDRELGFKTQSVLAAPMIGGGRVLGVIEMLNKKNGKLFSVSDQRLLTLMSHFSGDLLFTVIKQNQDDE